MELSHYHVRGFAKMIIPREKNPNPPHGVCYIYLLTGIIHGFRHPCPG